MTLIVITRENGTFESATGDAKSVDVGSEGELYTGKSIFAPGEWIVAYEPEQGEGEVDLIDAEIVPRVWESLTEVPEGVLVHDKDFDGTTWRHRGHTQSDFWGPFTEVIS